MPATGSSLLDTITRAWHHAAMHARSLLLAAAAALYPAVLAAADLEPPAQSHAPAQAAPATGSPFAPPDAACLEWTDGCRTCQRPAAGDTACSNVGVACVPQPPRCTRR